MTSVLAPSDIEDVYTTPGGPSERAWNDGKRAWTLSRQCRDNVEPKMDIDTLFILGQWKKEEEARAAADESKKVLRLPEAEYWGGVEVEVGWQDGEDREMEERIAQIIRKHVTCDDMSPRGIIEAAREIAALPPIAPRIVKRERQPFVYTEDGVPITPAEDDPFRNRQPEYTRTPAGFVAHVKRLADETPAETFEDDGKLMGYLDAPAEDTVEAALDVAREFIEYAMLWDHQSGNEDEVEEAKEALASLDAAQAALASALAHQPAPDREAAAALQALGDGYAGEIERWLDNETGEPYVFVSVENPDYKPGDGKPTRLVIDVGKLIGERR